MSNEATKLVAQMNVNTFTVADLYRRVGLLRECLDEALFHESKTPFAQVLITCLEEKGTKADAVAVAQWGQEVLSAFSRINISKSMQAVHTVIENLPVLTLYIPVLFPEEEIMMLGKWCRETCGATVMMDIHIDPNTAGGCSFVWNDTFHDFSFRSRLKENPDVITSTLSAYVEK